LDKLIELHIAGETVPLRPTLFHPFYVKRVGATEGEWIKAAELKVGDPVLAKSGAWTKVTAVSPIEKQETVYNFEVEEDHDYFVGAVGLLVHNYGPCFPDGSLRTNIVNATPTSSLNAELAMGSAESAFTEAGTLTDEAIASSREIIPESALGDHVPSGFAKYSTPTYQSPVGNMQVHFYMNPTTGQVLYGLDYKAVVDAFLFFK
jgi:Pretoxin HINT domain